MAKRLGADEFAKYHGLGNDYIVVDPAKLSSRLSASRVRSICERHYGIGSDGVLAIGPAHKADFGLRIFNPDGSAAEKSGNGLRVFSRFLYDFGYTKKTAFAVETPGGIVNAKLTLRAGKVAAIRVEMGQASFSSGAVGARGPERELVGETIDTGEGKLVSTCVSVGNPHCVIFVPELDTGQSRKIGPSLERHEMFPRRINVQFAKVVSGRVVEALIWERGAGETLASGSSACAIAAAAHRNGLVGRRVEVRMSGGKLAIEVGEDYRLTMTGPATPICRGKLIALL